MAEYSRSDGTGTAAQNLAGLTKDEREAMTAAFAAALEYRDTSAGRLARPLDTPDEAMARFRRALPDDSSPASQVIADMIAKASPGLHRMSAPTFFGYVLGGSHPVGVAADALVSAWGQNAASSTETPATAAMERVVCDWVADLLGLPETCGAGIVSGASVANFTGVLAARHALLAAQGWNVEQDGLFGAPPFPVLIGADAHSAISAALRYSGVGVGNMISVETDDQGRIRPDAFKAALDSCTASPLVILQAGQIYTGAFDPFADLIPQVRARGGWTHIDGAFGLWAAAVPELADRTAGMAEADSWATDLHKWLNAPFDAGMIFVRERSALVESMSARGAYLPAQNENWEPSDSTPELSRRARGVPSYAILSHLGRAGVREMILRHHRLANRIAERLLGEPGLRVLNRIDSNQLTLTCDDDPELTQRVLARVQERGKVYPSHGEWRGRPIIRISVIGYAMQVEHADLLTSEIIDALHACRGHTTSR